MSVIRILLHLKTATFSVKDSAKTLSKYVRIEYKSTQSDYKYRFFFTNEQHSFRGIAK